MPAQLLALSDGPSILLDKPILLLGRDLECDIRLDSRKISRRHCCVAQVGDRLLVRDLGSTNGVRVNGIRVLEGQLKAGDELTIGNYRYRVRWDPLAAPAPEAKQVDKKVRPSPEPVAAAPAVQCNEDALLEDADEPVALADPFGGPLPVPLAKAVGPAPHKEPEKILDVQAELPSPVPAARSRYDPIIPDDIQLAPQSDVVPELPAPDAANHTHHHFGKPTLPGAADHQPFNIPPT